jgi:8-amino-7-oxononanoate synthase
MQNLSQSLAERKTQHLYRVRRIVEGPQGPRVKIDGQEYLSFCSNDYLGLANHPEIVAALQKGANDYGVGSGASHLVNGHSRAHHALEEELAAFVQRPRALLFSSGYMANLGTITALVKRNDFIFADRLNHASLIDGAKLSNAKLKRYPHTDVETLATQLISTKPAANKLIVTDGVFSMDGDLAPLPALAKLAREHNAWLMVDDAHGLGILGEQGRGSVEKHSLDALDLPILMGTLGKAFGCFGAFVAGSTSLIETLIQNARTYIYTTALPAALAEATRSSLAIIKSDHWRRDRLMTNINRFRSGADQLGLNIMPSITPIQPLLVGESKQALQLSNKLYQRGLLITAIRPPTVAKGSARLRITLSAAHTDTHIDRLLESLAKLQ